jgi:uncharacterized protein (DUF1697 family)
MPTFVALLRGVNVGKAKRVPMADLRNLLVGLGYSEPKTLLNSGNAVFRAAGTSAPAHAKAISGAILQHLAVEVPVIVKSAKEFSAIVNKNPFSAASSDHSRLLVVFTQNEESLVDLEKIKALVAPPEAFAVGKYAAYLHCPDGILQSKAGEALLGKLGRPATTRNWATTLKLQALAGVA